MDDINPNKAQSLISVNSQLEELIFGGKERLAEELKTKHEEYKRNTETVFEELTGKKIDLDTKEGRAALKEKVDKAAAERQRKENQPKVVKALRGLWDNISNFFTRHMDVATLMNKISVTPGEMFGGKLQEMVTDKVDAATREYKDRKMMTQEMIRGKLKELMGPKWKKKWRKTRNVVSTEIYHDAEAVRKAREEYNNNKNSETKANLKKVELDNSIPDVTNSTQGKLYYFYNQFKDPANHPAFEEMWGPNYKEVAKQVEAALTPEVKAFADWQVNELFPSLYEHYNRKYREIYRTNLPWNEKYAGRIYREGVETQPLDLLGDSNTMNTSVGAASTIQRLNNKHKIKGMDGTDVLVTYLNDMEWFSAFANPLKSIDKMLLNPEISNLIRQLYGDVTMNWIRTTFKKVANKGVQSDMSAKSINLLTDQFIVSKLGLNPRGYVKTTYIISYLC